MATPTRDELEDLRNRGKTREEIATLYGVALSQVKRWISLLKVSKKVIRRHPVPKPTKVASSTHLPDDEGLTAMERAKRILGPRLTEKRHVGYFLDGKISNVTAILQVAGIALKTRPL